MGVVRLLGLSEALETEILFTIHILELSARIFTETLIYCRVQTGDLQIRLLDVNHHSVFV